MSLRTLEREIRELRQQIFEQQAENERLVYQQKENRALRQLEKSFSPAKSRQLMSILRADGRLVEAEDGLLILARDKYNLMTEMSIEEGARAIVKEEEYAAFDQKSQQSATMNSSTSIANSSPNATASPTEYSSEQIQDIFANPEKRKKLLKEVQSTLDEQREAQTRKMNQQSLTWGEHTRLTEQQQHQAMLNRRPKLDRRQLAERLLAEQRALP
jgi:hypothetical protein